MGDKLALTALQFLCEQVFLSKLLFNYRIRVYHCKRHHFKDAGDLL